jgi:hypothetical protein
MTFKELVETFNALLTPVIAGTTIYIAWQQYQVSQLSLRKDLYEKRLRGCLKSSQACVSLPWLLIKCYDRIGVLGFDIAPLSHTLGSSQPFSNNF